VRHTIFTLILHRRPLMQMTLDNKKHCHRSIKLNMLRSKYYFALAVAVVTGLPVSFFKVANAQMGGAYTPSTSPYSYPAPPAIDYQKPEQIRPDLYGPNGSDPASQFRPSNPSSPPVNTTRTYSEEKCVAANLSQLSQGLNGNNFMARMEAFGEVKCKYQR
jgi:hypothetical protein